uniref:Cytochrome P450 n=1 Tax=Amphimedon queenslandica TaxID=400682 RepID=A0A1X7SK66_AMPQE
MLTVLILFFIIPILIFLIWYRHYYIPYKVFSRLGIAHPPVEPFTGNVNGILRQGIIEALNNDINKYGKVFGWYIGTDKWMIVVDPNMLREIFIKSSDHFNQRPDSPVISIARDDLPPGLIFLKKDEWRVIKPIVTPSFSAKKLKLMSPLIERSCSSLKERFAEICESKKSSDLFDVFGQFTMETVLGAAFGSQVNVLKGEGDSLTEAAAGILNEATINQLLWGYVIMCKHKLLMKARVDNILDESCHLKT